MTSRVQTLLGHLQPNKVIAHDPNPGQVLFDERAKASFPVRKMTYLIDGGESNTQQKERMMMELERDPAFNNDDRYELTRPQVRERTMAKIRAVHHYIMNDPEHLSRMRFDLLSLVDPGLMTRMGVHFGLFFGAVRGQATAEQLSDLLEKGLLTLKNFYGCFAMTELGHGSNVAGIETTATFDPASDEFIIHTPSLTATKWWIGGAAQSATHSVVFAQLIVDGKRYGVKSFLVQLRDPCDFSLMPGIAIGDCGSKMGRQGIDNGWIQFTNVRIPRENMLMRHTKVNSDGSVQEPPLQQLTYGALINGRVQMVMDSANVAKQALTIAIRYGCVRRQFSLKDGEGETQILNYASHQYRLMPLLALAFAMHFGGMQTQKNYMEMMDQIEGAQPGDDMKSVLEDLKSVHATSAGLKAFCTWNCLEMIEQCRQALGGHGYSSYAGLASMYQDFAVQCSWEGDNTVMMLQTGRYLLNCYRDAKAGVTMAETVDYLNNLERNRSVKSTISSPQDAADLNGLLEAYACATANLVVAAGEQYETLIKKGTEPASAYEECAVAMLTCARAQCYLYLLRRFNEAINSADPALQPVLRNLCTLYAVYNIEKVIGVHLLQYGYYSPAQYDLVRQQVPVFCRAVRADAIPLVDSFNLTDFVVGSPLGRYDGDIYRAYFNKVSKVPGSQDIPPYFETVTKKFFNRKIHGEQ